MSLLGDWLRSKRMRDPVRGVARVAGVLEPPHTVSATCKMTLVVQAEGVPPTPVEHSSAVRVERWPSIGQTLPVTVDRSDPRRLRVEWEEVPSGADQARERAERMAAEMRGDPDRFGSQ